MESSSTSSKKFVEIYKLVIDPKTGAKWVKVKTSSGSKAKRY